MGTQNNTTTLTLLAGESMDNITAHYLGLLIIGFAVELIFCEVYSFISIRSLETPVKRCKWLCTEASISSPLLWIVFAINENYLEGYALVAGVMLGLCTHIFLFEDL